MAYIVVAFTAIVVTKHATNTRLAYDATHSVQRPGAGAFASEGDRSMVAPLARAAVAVGIDALFLETHPAPEEAPCDGPSQIDFEGLDALLAEVGALSRTRGGG